jgi:hypothetical protein
MTVTATCFSLLQLYGIVDTHDVHDPQSPKPLMTKSAWAARSSGTLGILAGRWLASHARRRGLSE